MFFNNTGQWDNHQADHIPGQPGWLDSPKPHPAGITGTTRDNFEGKEVRLGVGGGKWWIRVQGFLDPGSTLPETNSFGFEHRRGPKRQLNYSNHSFPGAMC